MQDETSAREAVRAGAQDYLIKSKADGKMLSHAIQYVVHDYYSKKSNVAAFSIPNGTSGNAASSKMGEAQRG